MQQRFITYGVLVVNFNSCKRAQGIIYRVLASDRQRISK
jgi:hypothetical protein